MLKKTIKFVDYNGVEREEDKYFNLSRAELLEMEMSEAGGMGAKLERIVKSQDPSAIMATFKDIIMRAYGEKSDDGKRFIKSKELSEAFTQTEAYSELLMEIIQDSDKAAAFINGIIPPMNEAVPAPKK